MEQEFLSQLSLEKGKIIVPRRQFLPPEQVQAIFEKAMSAWSLTKDECTAVFAIMFQQGGAVQRCNPNLEIQVFSKTFRLSQVRKVLRDAGHKGAERKFARSIGDEIYKICSTLGLPGHMSQRILLANPTRNFTDDETVWFSDFQILNPSIPTNLRELLTSRNVPETSTPAVTFKKATRKKATGK